MTPARSQRSCVSPAPKFLAICLALVATACAAEQQCKKMHGEYQCLTVGGPEGAAVTGAGAAVVWATAGGCAVAGCAPPRTCNKVTGLCERIRCGEGRGNCPDGLQCDAASLTCH